ncbi:MAG: tRNA adenosine(34) deaminase TadA [bacterium]
MPAHSDFMKIAIQEANIAEAEGEVPVGAVAVIKGEIIARAHNSVIKMHDPSAHAEILALRELGLKLKNYRFNEVSLYVTIEPCIMCAGAIIHARIKQLVFGAHDDKAGAITLFDMFNDKRLNHHVEVISGVLEQETSEILQKFFQKKRYRERTFNKI